MYGTDLSCKLNALLPVQRLTFISLNRNSRRLCFLGKNFPLRCVLDIQIVPQQHHAKFLQRGGDVAPRLSEDAESTDTNPFPKFLLQKPPPQKCILFGEIVLFGRNLSKLHLPDFFD